jgi:hypothetical protein
MNKLILLIILPIIICCSRNNGQKAMITSKNEKQICINDSCTFFKINVTDKYLYEVISQYSKMYDFNGDGVILATVKQKSDTTKYYLNLLLRKDFFKKWLLDKKFVLYDTIAQRIAILYTGLESTIGSQTNEALGDTILNEYLRDYNENGIFEIWQLEYTRIDSTITRKVYYGYPF